MQALRFPLRERQEEAFATQLASLVMAGWRLVVENEVLERVAQDPIARVNPPSAVADQQLINGQMICRTDTTGPDCHYKASIAVDTSIYREASRPWQSPQNPIAGWVSRQKHP